MERMREERGQGTVEAAFVIPVLFLVLLMLLQPGIVLYDRMVMKGAAAEACRLLATGSGEYGGAGSSCEAFVRHRLASVPQHDCFHVHGGGCSWRIETTGGEDSGAVTVSIANELKPLPLVGIGMSLVGATNGSGYLEIEESVTMPVQPSWVDGAPAGRNVSGWIGAWCE